MNTLLAVAECYVHMAPPKGIIAAKEAEAIARSMGSDQGLSQSLGMHALGLLETGDIPEADTLLHHALAIDRKRNDTHAIAVDCIRLTIVSNARDYSTITYITEALPLLRHTSYYRELASAHFWTNIEYSSVDGYILHLDTAKYLFEQVGDSSGIAQCLDMQMRFLPVANDAALAKAYMRDALRMARSVDDHALEARLLANSCAHALNASDYAGALLAGLDAINIAGAAGCTVTRDQSMGNVATVYEELGDPASALPYYRQILAGARRSGAKSDLANSYASLGSAFLSLGDLDSALYWNEQLEELSRTFASQAGYAEVGLGKVYAARKEWSLALDHLMKATAPTKELDDYFELALDIELDMARVLLHADEQSLRTHGFIPAQRWAQARVHLQKVLAMASAREFMKYKQEALYELSRIAEHDGDVAGAYALHKRYSAVKDSVLDTDKAKAVALLQIKYETEKKEEQIVLLGKDKEVQVKEIQKQKLMRNGFMGGFALVALFAGVFFFQRNRISKARKLSDELLLNILPEEVAEELKAMGSADAQLIDQVTVLFTDFKGFTAMSELLTPKELVRDIHECFSAFDHIITAHGIEKIKTIGDAYMAAGGLPMPNATHALDVVKAALEIRDFIEQGKALKIAKGLPYFEIRIGVHTGPVVAGIVGVKKFAYDIWGDTVNTASRMESSGEVGQVNISEATYALVREVREVKEVMEEHNAQPATQQPAILPAFTFTPRGKVQAKGKGVMEMYFVDKSHG